MTGLRRRGGWTPLVLLGASVVLLVGLSGVALAATGRTALDSMPTQRSVAFPGGRYFNVACGFSHRNNDDPIVFPGAPGRSHNHTYIGNRHVDASSTPQSLLGGASTCGELDSSTYWVPTLYEGYEPRTPLAAVLYYTRHTSDPIVAFPPGLKMIAGNASAQRPQPKGVVSWSCGSVASKRFAAVPACPNANGQYLLLTLRFPNCWNGKTTDSANHKSHMAYSARGSCPATHPVRLPTIVLVLIYSPTSRRAQLASGKFGGHADFMNGWDQQALSRLVTGLNY